MYITKNGNEAGNINEYNHFTNDINKYHHVCNYHVKLLKSFSKEIKKGVCTGIDFCKCVICNKLFIDIDSRLRFSSQTQELLQKWTKKEIGLSLLEEQLLKEGFKRVVV